MMKKTPKLSTSEILQNKINKAYLTFILKVKAYIIFKMLKQMRLSIYKP